MRSRAKPSDKVAPQLGAQHVTPAWIGSCALASPRSRMSRQRCAHVEEIGCDPTTASFFVGREVPVASVRPEVPVWQERIYAFMVRNAVSAPDYFLIAPRQVVELGTRVEI
jgi:K+ transporter